MDIDVISLRRRKKHFNCTNLEKILKTDPFKFIGLFLFSFNYKIERFVFFLDKKCHFATVKNTLGLFESYDDQCKFREYQIILVLHSELIRIRNPVKNKWNTNVFEIYLTRRLKLTRLRQWYKNQSVKVMLTRLSSGFHSLDWKLQRERAFEWKEN